MVAAIFKAAGKTGVKQGIKQADTAVRIGKHLVKNATEDDVIRANLRTKAISSRLQGMQTGYLDDIELKYIAKQVQDQQEMLDMAEQLGYNFIPSDFPVDRMGIAGSPKTPQQWLDYKRRSTGGHIDDVGSTPLDVGSKKRSDRATSQSITPSDDVAAYGESMRTGEAVAPPHVFTRDKFKTKGQQQHHKVLKREADPFHSRMRQLEAQGDATLEDIVNLEFMAELLDVPAGSRQSAILDMPGRNRTWGPKVGGEQHSWLHKLAQERGAQLKTSKIPDQNELLGFKERIMSLNDPKQITEEYFDFLLRQAIPMTGEAEKVLERLVAYSTKEIAAMTKEQWTAIMVNFENIEAGIDVARIEKFHDFAQNLHDADKKISDQIYHDRFMAGE